MKQKVCNLKLDSSRNRHFSEAFKRRVVGDLISKKYTIREASILYEVSRTAVYNWLYQYSPYHEKGVRVVVEMESEASKSRKLQERVAELERVVGRKQMEIDFLEKLIEIASKEVGVDIKKNYSTKRSSGSESTDQDTATK